MIVSDYVSGKHARNSPGRRVAGAGVVVAANGLCVTVAGMEFLDDLDMIDRVRSRVEVLREPFLLNKLNGMLLC